MNQLTESYVDSLALNAAAIKNGKELARKNSFQQLGRAEDGTLLFGECKGSGKEPYRCSADFVNPESPVFRCSCPSRQFPCKHLLGLMYAYVSGSPFAVAEVPQDIADKREKAEKREKKKREAANVEGTAPAKRKTNKSALVKKTAAQLEGLEIAEKLLRSLVQSGLGSADKKTIKLLSEQCKQLGNYYIPGIQIAFRGLLSELDGGGERETMYTRAASRMTLLHSLLKKSREHLTARLENPDLPLDVDSPLEEKIGHAWQIAELRERGLALGDTRLLQLAFRSFEDPARGEYVDEGYWIELATGRIRVTRTYRPFRAAKHIREEDSVFDVVHTGELLVYPGELNARVRWETQTFERPDAPAYDSALSAAMRSFPEAIKQVKNQIKNPLSDKHPVLLLAFKEIAVDGEGRYALVDEQENKLPLADIAYLEQPTTHLLPLLHRRDVKGQALLAMFGHDAESGRLSAQPLSVVTDRAVVRLLY
ncbi:SWIM zinc finger family protein [Cohnella cellulosilytica]|uniref:SWIM zinc finger family protein n=1 Tax=Cohnella cellulosilytica TaxID=986710 RepID=A0ABW2FJ86_9BACL